MEALCHTPWQAEANMEAVQSTLQKCLTTLFEYRPARARGCSVARELLEAPATGWSGIREPWTLHPTIFLGNQPTKLMRVEKVSSSICCMDMSAYQLLYYIVFIFTQRYKRCLCPSPDLYHGTDLQWAFNSGSY